MLDVSIARIYQSQNNQQIAKNFYQLAENNCKQKVLSLSDRNETVIELLAEYTEIADYYFENGETEKAINLTKFVAEKIDGILEKNDTDLEANSSLADTFEKLGDYQKGNEAKTYYEKSLQIWTKLKESYPLLPDETEKVEAIKTKLNSL
jgi:tetratricopeptide (TPR) repeat protein